MPIDPEGYVLNERCSVCGGGFTTLEWLNRHTDPRDNLSDCHDRCCPSCNHLTRKMIDCLFHLRTSGGSLVRFPNGYWARKGWSAWQGPCFGTSTIEALVRRGVCAYTLWKEAGRVGGAKFPIEVSVVKEWHGKNAHLEKSTPAGN